MLHPAAEGKGIEVNIRFGPKTSQIISKGIIMLFGLATIKWTFS